MKNFEPLADLCFRRTATNDSVLRDENHNDRLVHIDRCYHIYLDRIRILEGKDVRLHNESVSKIGGDYSRDWRCCSWI